MLNKPAKLGIECCICGSDHIEIRTCMNTTQCVCEYCGNEWTPEERYIPPFKKYECILSEMNYKLSKISEKLDAIIDPIVRLQACKPNEQEPRNCPNCGYAGLRLSCPHCEGYVGFIGD